MSKKQSLTIQEMLEKALVPKSEQPYKVPRNWVWVKLGFMCKVKGGKRLPKGHSLIEDKTEHPYIRVTDFINQTVELNEVKYILPETYKIIRNYTIYKEDIFISIAGTIGKVGIVPESLDGGNLTENAAKLTAIKGFKQKYLLNLLASEDLQQQIASSTIATTQSKLALFRIEEFYTPLPPISEQQRIVDHIESLFAKLEQAKGLIQDALDSFENRKSAILHKAFSGELTKKWREENGVGLETWKESTFKDLCTIITDGTHQTPTYTENGHVFLSSKNVTSGKIDWDNVKYIPEELHNQLYKRLAPKMNDILLAKNGTTGVAAIVDRDCIFDIYVSLALLRPDAQKIDPHFLLYSINNPVTKEKFNHELTGIGLQNLHLRDIRSTKIPVPKIDEQKEIVSVLDDLLKKEQNAKELYDLIESIELMKKSILARAFRGELGTNDPEEESALELLKEVLAERL